MFIVAVTGGIATGKSTLSRVFARNGIPVVDADKIAREIVQPGKPCWREIRKVFGDDVFHSTKEINREALGRAIFSDKDLRTKLNKITHPVIHRMIIVEAFKHFLSGCRWIVLELPLLFETGLWKEFVYKIITVTCDSETQLKRLMARNEYSEEDARKRIESQMPLEEKCEQSDFVVENSGGIDEIEAAALNIVKLMNESNQHWRNRFALLGIILAITFACYYLVRMFKYSPSIKN